MTLVDIEVSLSDDERAVRDVARRFAAETLRPGRRGARPARRPATT